MSNRILKIIEHYPDGFHLKKLKITRVEDGRYTVLQGTPENLDAAIALFRKRGYTTCGSDKGFPDFEIIASHGVPGDDRNVTTSITFYGNNPEALAFVREHTRPCPEQDKASGRTSRGSASR